MIGGYTPTVGWWQTDLGAALVAACFGTKAEELAHEAPCRLDGGLVSPPLLDSLDVRSLFRLEVPDETQVLALNPAKRTALQCDANRWRRCAVRGKLTCKDLELVEGADNLTSGL